MNLNSDLILTHPLWDRAETELIDTKHIFARLVDIFVIACAIGIQSDKTITEFEQSNQARTIGRNTISNLANQDLRDLMDFMLQNAVLTSKTINLSNDDRIRLAFDPEYSLPKLSPAAFLIGFANYGISEIFNKIDSSENINNIVLVNELNNYLSSLELKNFDEIFNGITLEELNA